MSKGGNFEWNTARALSRWLTYSKDKDQFVRSTASGAWATLNKNVRQGGDVAPNGPMGEEFLTHFFVECKHYKNQPDFWHIFTSHYPKLMEWWRKAKSQAMLRHPILIVRRNNKPILIIHDEELWEPPASRLIRVEWLGQHVVVYPLEYLLDCDPRVILRDYFDVNEFQPTDSRS